MSSSDVSWCTADGETTEYSNLTSNINETSECNCDDNIDKSVKIPQNSENFEEIISIKRSGQPLDDISKNVEILQWLKESYTLKIPWILVISSVIQIVVYYTSCSETINLLMFNPQKKNDLWRFLTYHIIHFGRTHLFLNVFLQICIGMPLETEQGHFRILLIYVCGISCGAIGSMLTNPTQSIIGSSAAVYSLLLSHISHCILNWSNISSRILICRLTAVFALFGSDILFSFLKYFHWIQSEPKISFSAHFSGGIAGFIAGLIIFSKTSYSY